MMNVANIIPCSTINGDGLRLIIAFSGCSLNCKGCFSKKYQDFEYGKTVKAEQLAQLVIKEYRENDMLDGITISGGNPQEQTDLKKFLTYLKKHIPELNIAMWTGFTWDEINSSPSLSEHLPYLDFMVTGRFEEDKKCEDQYYGSRNQEVWRKKEDGWIKDE